MDATRELELIMCGEEPMPATGELTLTVQVQCGALCGAWWMTDNAKSRTQAASMVRNRGWSLTKHDGWICPECKKSSRKNDGEHGDADRDP